MKRLFAVMFVLTLFVGSMGNTSTAYASADEVPKIMSLPKPNTLVM